MSTRAFRRRVTAPTPAAAIAKSPPAFPLGKNLRWTAVALAAKLSADHERPSAQVADEIALSAAADLRRLNPARDAAAVERNTRRRVYDALKVMVAAGCVQRDGKALRWIGVDDLAPPSPPAANEAPSVRVQLCQIRRCLARKRALATELQARLVAFSRLVERRPDDPDARLSPALARIHFPMVVVKARTPHVAYAPNREHVRLTSAHPFKLYSESDIVLMMSERRRPRLNAPQKKPRTASKSKPSSRHKHHRPRGEGSPPPPPPPSPAMLKDEDQPNPFALSRSRSEPPQFCIDLKQLQVLAKVRNDGTEPTPPVSDEADVGETSTDYSLMDHAKAELCLDPEIPLQYEHDDDEKPFFEHMQKRPAPPLSILGHDLDSRGDESTTTSIGVGIPNTQFEHLPSRTCTDEPFAPNIDLICDEELSIPLSVGDTTDTEHVQDTSDIPNTTTESDAEPKQDFSSKDTAKGGE